MLPRTPVVAAAAAVLLCVSSSVASVSPAAASRVQARLAVRALTSLDAQLVARINAVRAARGLPRLRCSSRLRAAAAAHSREMVQRGYFEHTSADGQSMVARVKRFYRARAAAFGEALLWDSADVKADAAVTAWLSDSAHRAILLDPHFREIGVSSVYGNAVGGAYGGSPATVITADFGAHAR